MQKLAQNRLLFYVVALLWLPIGVVFYPLLRFGAVPLEWFVWLSLVPTTVGGLSLAFAWRAIYRRNYTRTAGIFFIILAPISILAGVIGGLFGPIGLIVYPTFFSLPAWIGYGIIVLRQKRQVQHDDNSP